MSDRASFEAAIKENRYDTAIRRVFADWLDENGFDDEAVFHREWTAEWQRAEDWLRNFATTLGVGHYSAYGGDDKEITYADMMRHAKAWVDSQGDSWPEYFTQIGSENARDEMHAHADEFWKNYAIVTKTEIDPNMDKHFYSCSC